MLVAVFSDIHANLPAFEAILRDSDEAGVEERWCLGDVVGYGADPNLCVELARERCEVCLVGNHDLAVLGELDTSTFSGAAATAVEWTAEHTEKANLDFLAGLGPSDAGNAAALYHASPRDPVWEYVLWPEQAADCIAVQEKRVSFVGHSHVALFFSTPADDDGEADEAHGYQAGAGTRLEIGEGRWLINPGSVGQPRDGDPRAAYAVLDTHEGTATFYRASYPIDEAQRRIRARRLPEMFAERLALGL